jgi:diguanylate cyclase (GGDEF)-like protein
MESSTQSARGVEELDPAQGQEELLQHRPFRSWALQQDLISLLGSEPDWENGAAGTGDTPDRSDGARTLNGQGFLRDELQNNPEFDLRTKTSLALWTSVLITDSINQYGPTGLKMASQYFTVMIIGVVIALVFTAITYPRLSPRSFPVVEQIMLTAAFGLIAFQCSVTGGADSPYALWLVFTIFYTAYFMPSTQVACNTALGVGIALAPLIYEPSKTSANAAVFALLLAAITCTLSYTIFYRRQLSRGAERGVKFLALADPLTSVANLRAFEQLCEQLTTSSPGTFAIAMVDMNGLKGANTVFGYDVGDDMVVRLARLMADVSGAEDQIARIGGDEFAVVLPAGDSRDIDNWRAKFDAALAAHNERIRGRLPQVSVSTGMATFPTDGRTTDELINVADSRMYAEKSPAVSPPHVVDDPSPINATRLLSGPYALGTPERRFSRRRFTTQAGAFWGITAFFVLAWPLIPGADIPHPKATVALGIYCVLISAIAFAGRTKLLRGVGWRIADIATLTVALPGMWITGGWESPFQATGLLVIAYYAQVYRGAEAVARITIVVGLYTIAFWTSGDVSPAGQSLYATVVTAELVIAAILQINAQAIDGSLKVIRESATHDALTGLQNLYAFRERLMSTPAVSPLDEEAHLHRPALVIADLDKFRDMNTQAGHRGGDAILREAARRLETAAGKDATIYRVGGDEFAILFTVDRFGDAAAIAERCRRALAFVPPDHLQIDGQVSASVGFSVLRDGMSREGWVIAVESALAESKGHRGDSVAADTNLML